MANFFRALGAATPALNMTARTMLDIGREIREGPIRAEQMKQRVALTQQRAEQEKFEFEQMKKKEAELDTPQEAKIYWDQISSGWTEEERKQGWDALVKGGFVDSNGITSKRKMQQVGQMAIMSDSIRTRIQEANRGASLRNLEKMKGAFDKAVESGDQEKIDKAMKAFDDAKKKHDQLLGNAKKLNDGVTAYKMASKLKAQGKLPPELEATLMAVAQTGEGLDDALTMLRDLARKEEQKEKPMSEAERARIELEKERQRLYGRQLDIEEKRVSKPKPATAPRAKPEPKPKTEKPKAQGKKPPLESFLEAE